MTSEERKEALSVLVNKFQRYKIDGKLDLTSEETIRNWLNDFLEIFGWDVRNTNEVLQEKKLSKTETNRVMEIESTNTKPDYTLKLGDKKLSFLDAKDITVNLKDHKESAFQIKSYGWSIQAPCTFMSNFEEMSIHDTTYIPDSDQKPDLGRIYLTLDEYVDNFELLDQHFLKKNIYSGKLDKLYSDTFKGDSQVSKITPDETFASLLSEFRLNLAKNILRNNPDIIRDNDDRISFIVQILINRIVFVRVCEAKKIEEEDLLVKFRYNGFWQSFKSSSYIEFHEHYDGPLFDQVNVINQLDIDDEVFDQILTSLYYPSPYRFQVIPTKLLSDVYELFLANKLKIKNGEVFEELKSEYSKTKGAVSTPQFIVKEIVKRTLGLQKITNEGLKSIFESKILDPACGSGVFLIEVYEYLESLVIKLFQERRPREFEEYFLEDEGQFIITIAGKRKILECCIYGVDIDQEAVEVTKMALCLKVIDNAELYEFYEKIGVFGNKILQGVGNNIKWGNSLVSSDIFNMYPDFEDENEIKRTVIFNWEEEFEDIFERTNGFDYIVGNPPYVEVKNYNLDLPHMHMYLKEKYETAGNQKVDLAIPFIERALNLLNEEGMLGYIVQKRFFKTQYGKRSRTYLSENNFVDSIIDFESTEIFKGRITYVAMLILSRVSQEDFYYKYLEDEVEYLESSLRELSPSAENQKNFVKLPADTLSSSPWNFEDPDTLIIKSKLTEHFGSLSDFVNVRVGVQALWDTAYHIRVERIENGLIYGNTGLGDVVFEEDACRPMMCNINFYPFRTDTCEYQVIFPYEVNEKVEEIQFSEFGDKYPRCAAYLSDNKDVIQRNVETYDSDERWHLFTRANNHGARYPNVLVPMTSLDSFATLTLNPDVICDNANVYFLELDDVSLENLYGLSAIINSTVFSVLARSEALAQQNGYFKFNKQFLDPVPFPGERFYANSDGLLIQLFRISQNIEDIQSDFSNQTPYERRRSRLRLNQLWEHLDQLVYELYELEDEEIQHFKEIGRNRNRVRIFE